MMPTLDIPDHWSPEQALAVYELLDQLRDRVWDRYSVPIIDAFRADLEQDNLSPHLQLPLFPFDDDIPF